MLKCRKYRQADKIGGSRLKAIAAIEEVCRFPFGNFSFSSPSEAFGQAEARRLPNKHFRPNYLQLEAAGAICGASYCYQYKLKRYILSSDTIL